MGSLQLMFSLTTGVWQRCALFLVQTRTQRGAFRRRDHEEAAAEGEVTRQGDLWSDYCFPLDCEP